MNSSKQKAFLDAYKPCHDAFTRFCSALAYGKMDSEDLIQDVMLTAFRNFEKIKNKEKLLHYLIRSARNTSISAWRKKKFSVELIESHTQKLVAKNLTADKILEIQMLYKLIAKLPKLQREALILFEISGFNMKEIADIQNSSVGAIKTKISRARTLLKQFVQEENSIRRIESSIN